LLNGASRIRHEAGQISISNIYFYADAALHVFTTDLRGSSLFKDIG
jgi:hypothetical protein